MRDDGVFIAADASTEIIHAHQNEYTDSRFYIFDVDLDQVLPFHDGSISAFSGNLLNNVDNYRGPLKEVCRCLKANGRFAIIECFYEAGTQTYDYLKQRNAVYSSLEYFISCCRELGLIYRGHEIRKEIIGKMSDGDLLPIGNTDLCRETIVYFEKAE